MKYIEANFDGLVGPTHNYAGLSYGNVASTGHQGKISRPKEAALQGLEKMYSLFKLGMVQGVIPPQQRPNIDFLKSVGFKGTDEQILRSAASSDPLMLAIASSAASMWTANAATVCPSADSGDGKVHFTAANLLMNAHRAQEHSTTSRILQSIFPEGETFSHHQALDFGPSFGDEGAANHIRLCKDYGKKGLQIFVYGKSALKIGAGAPEKYPARQTLESCQALARLHGLSEESVLFIQQNPSVIDQGVFHNDVISVGNRDVLFYHEAAFAQGDKAIAQIREKFSDLVAIKVENEKVSVKEAVSTYLFNTQIINSPNSNSLKIIAPFECKNSKTVSSYLASLVEDKNNPIDEVLYFDVKQSMSNGGGPACLRLRVVLSEDELAAVNPSCLMSDVLYSKLKHWINTHYRDELSPKDLSDSSLLKESLEALKELTTILDLDRVYPFQL